MQMINCHETYLMSQKLERFEGQSYKHRRFFPRILTCWDSSYFPCTKMVPGKGNVSKGKGAANVKGSTSATKVKRERVSEPEDSDEEVSLADVRAIDYAKALPRFTAIAGRSEDGGVMMDDLDALQMELETLLNCVVLRSLNLQREIAGMTEKPPSPGKRSKQDERSPKKFKDQQGKLRDAHTPPLLKQMKIKSALAKPILPEGGVEELPPLELMKTSTAKNDTPNKFWASVEPYCAPFTDDDLKLVEELISNHNDDEEYLKIPPLGRHYTLRWAEDDLLQEQREGSRFGEKKKITTGSSMGTEEAQRLMDTAAKNNGEANPTSSTGICGPMTQRLISALLEENIVTSIQETMESEGQDENAKSTGEKAPVFNGPQAAALERRIRQELEEQGILTSEEANINPADDEILTELRRCQGELRAISQHNLKQLKRLYRLSQEEMKRQDTRKKLMAADAEVLDTYRKMVAAKQKNVR
ncbi:Transcriptional adapter 3 [Daphnia magna]|uniref:Transcriptional adapter 3 n=1 Tax=Daphnia magna TaxID=35525 RepID=A0A164UWP5_9CRUS|nr:Transcriptional adapter 3 [Daphnia magna]